MKIKGKKIVTSLYDKRDNFNFEIVSYPDLCGNIAANTGYAVFMSQLMRITRNCRLFEDAESRVMTLKSKLLGKGYEEHKIRKAAVKCLDRNDWMHTNTTWPAIR